MRMEQEQSSCGNVSSKAMPSIKLNKKGSKTATSLIQHAGEGTLQHNQVKKKSTSKILSFFPIYFLSSNTHLLFMPVTSLPCVSVGRHACGCGPDPCSNPTTNTQPNHTLIVVPNFLNPLHFSSCESHQILMSFWHSPWNSDKIDIFLKR